VLKYENEKYYLDPDRVAIDVQIYKERMNALKKRKQVDPAEIEQALLPYEGLLLNDEDYIWAAQDMELYEKLATQGRFQLMEAYLHLQEYEKAVATAERAIEYSPYDEDAYRMLMIGYHKLGRNDQVLSVYNRLSHKLEELRIKPSEMTSKLYKEICS
jgi:two-component SAPR family response regulator